jgi:hypothetical protein
MSSQSNVVGNWNLDVDLEVLFTPSDGAIHSSPLRGKFLMIPSVLPELAEALVYLQRKQPRTNRFVNCG